jgi:tetratricopeptide (TPR) repeat protein
MGANQPLPNDGFDILSYLTAPDVIGDENPLLGDCPTGLFGSDEPPVDVAPLERGRAERQPIAPVIEAMPPLMDEQRAEAAPVMGRGGRPSERLPILPPRTSAGRASSSDPDFPNPFRSRDAHPLAPQTAAAAPVEQRWGGRMTDISPPTPVSSSTPHSMPRRLPADNLPRSSAPPAARHPGDRGEQDAAIAAEVERRMAARAAQRAARPEAPPAAPAPRAAVAPAAPASPPAAPPAAAPAARAPELSRHKISDIRDVDLLVAKGKAAFEAGQTGLSAALFQRAYQLAPFRDDVRRWLEQALEEQAVEAASGGSRPASVGAPGVYWKREVDALLSAPANAASNETPNLPAPTRSTLAIFRPSAFRWVWGTAVAIIVVAVVLAGWPVLSEAAGRLIDLRSPTVREAERLFAEANEADAIGRTDIARDTLVAALDLADLPADLRTTIGERLGELHHRLGNRFFLDNEFDDAIAAFEAAIEARPGVAEYYGDLAMAHYLNAKGSWSRLRGNGSIDKEGLRAALAAFDHALELDDSKVQWLWSAADCHVRMGNTPLAIEFWRQIARSDDPDQSAYIQEARKALKSHGIAG